GVKIAQAAQVKKLVIFHHDPTHNDEFMDAIEIQSQQVFAGSIVAREGMKILVNEGISIAY
ncbi:MAG: MBL fold metallo-hydrolase, partial [Chamaesiphon sp.]|nr:MBL fold metallo-hydrolase [Chamaesiphon sp.]